MKINFDLKIKNMFTIKISKFTFKVNSLLNVFLNKSTYLDKVIDTYKFNSEINEEQKKANFSESKASQNAPNEVG